MPKGLPFPCDKTIGRWQKVDFTLMSKFGWPRGVIFERSLMMICNLPASKSISVRRFFKQKGKSTCKSTCCTERQETLAGSRFAFNWRFYYTQMKRPAFVSTAPANYTCTKFQVRSGADGPKKKLLTRTKIGKFR